MHFFKVFVSEGGYNYDRHLWQEYQLSTLSITVNPRHSFPSIMIIDDALPSDAETLITSPVFLKLLPLR